MAFDFSWKSSCSWFRVVGSTYKARLRTMNYGICSCKPKQYSLLRLTTSAWARRLHVHEEPSVSMTCGTQNEMDNWQLPLPPSTVEYLISVISPHQQPIAHFIDHDHPAIQLRFTNQTWDGDINENGNQQRAEFNKTRPTINKLTSWELMSPFALLYNRETRTKQTTVNMTTN